MNTERQTLTATQQLVLITLYILQAIGDVNQDTQSRWGRGLSRYWKQKALFHAVGIANNWHTRTLLRELCSLGLLDREIVGNAFLYRLTPSTYAHFDSMLSVANTLGMNVPERVGLYD